MTLLRRLRGRPGFCLLGIVAAAQILAFVALDAGVRRASREQVEAALRDTSFSARRDLAARAAEIGAALSPAVGEAALREPAAARTLLERLRGRAQVDLLFVASEGRVVANGSSRRGASLLASRLAALQPATEPRVLALDTEVFQVLEFPLPGRPSASLVAARLLDARFAEDLERRTRTEVAVVVREPGSVRRVSSSSLPAMRSASLGLVLSRLGAAARGVVPVEIFREAFLASVEPLGGAEAEADLVLLRSFDRELQPMRDSQLTALLLSACGLALALFGALFLARRPAAPVAPAAAAPAGQPGEPRGKTPAMPAQGADDAERQRAARERLHSVIGKVVSPAVAQGILAEGPGRTIEERTTTILVAYLRGLRAVDGAYPPRDAVDLLSACLSRMSEVVVRHGGVVDQFTGSGITAIFGAPELLEDDAGSAMAAALAMQSDLDALNRELASNGLQSLEMGVGVHAVPVIVGAIDIAGRRSYTVIRDGVAYAVRLAAWAMRGRTGGRVLASADTVRRARRAYAVRPLAGGGGPSGPESDLVYMVLGERVAAEDAASAVA